MARPISKRLRHHDDWRALSTINAYRCLIAVGLLGAQFLPLLQDVVVVAWPALFEATSLLYVIAGAAAVICTQLRWPQIRLQVAAFIALDTAFLACIMFATAGVTGGLGALLIVFIACAGALLSIRSAAFLAALATLATLAQEALRPLAFADADSAFFQAGMLGMLFFVVTGLAQWLARRVRSSQALVAAHAGTLRNLTELNRRIIEQMEMGAVVLDGAHRIQLTNAAAVRLLGLTSPPEPNAALHKTSAALATALDAWLRSPGNLSRSIDVGPNTLLPSFSVLPTFSGHAAGAHVPIVAFLEDASRQNEQAHNLKLAALGRLSAGIAHEIRNPLSAIAHAAQLLAESEQLGDDDRKLLDMIHRHSQRIDTIVEDVMGLSRRRDSEPPPLLLEPCLQQGIAEYRQSSGDPASITLAGIDTAQQVRFDPGHLRRVLLNLWQNAERHARRADATLHIRLLGSHSDTGTFCLDIVDNGPGIDATAINRVLEPFYTTGNGGIGLGLHVARELCESNGARLLPLADADGARFRIVFSVPSNRLDHG